MPQTFTQLHYHLVFSTKLREPVLTPDIRDQVWDYLGGVVRGEGGLPLAVGGMSDHVHLLVTIPRITSIADAVRQLKAVSSTWIHGKLGRNDVWWQTGYAAFSVSHSAIDSVRDYINNQELHHRTRSFQEELRLLLVKHGLEPDEQYMWE